MLHSDPLISEYLSQMNAHIATKYAWLTYRGNCLVTVEDLQQLAAITLVKLTASWDSYLATRGLSRSDDVGGLFWNSVKNNVKQDLLKYYAREGQADNFGAETPIVEETDDEDELHKRTTITAVTESPEWGVIRDAIIDAYALMPRRFKVVVALLQFDGLDQAQAADVLGVSQSAVSLTMSKAREYLREVARSQFVSSPSRAAPFSRSRWTEPATFAEYVTSRHRMDTDEFLGIVHIAFRTDPIYLVHLLGQNDGAGKNRGTFTLTPEQQARVDYLSGHGISLKAVAETIGVPYHQVYRYAKAEERRAYTRRYRAGISDQ